MRITVVSAAFLALGACADSYRVGDRCSRVERLLGQQIQDFTRQSLKEHPEVSVATAYCRSGISECSISNADIIALSVTDGTSVYAHFPISGGGGGRPSFAFCVPRRLDF